MLVARTQVCWPCRAIPAQGSLYRPCRSTQTHDCGDTLALRWRNLELNLACLSAVETADRLNQQHMAKEPKTPCSRCLIVLTPSLAIPLRRHGAKRKTECLLLGRELTDSNHVLAYVDGTPLDPSTTAHAFNKVIRKAGLPCIGPHDLRHTHASLMLTAGVNPKVVGERLGHSSVRITLHTYSHVLPGLQEAAGKRFDHFVLSVGQTSDVCKRL
jgi:integrase